MKLSDDEIRNLARLNDRLQLIKDRTTAVAHGWSTGLYLFGEGGIGKTYTVQQQLDALKVPYKVTNSRLTGKGLFELLEDHPDSIHLLEDMESLCKSSNAAGVLRSALWTANKDKGKGRQERLITWRVGGEKRLVTFTGGIILTMNAPLDDLPELRAVKTRIAVAKLEPTNAEIAALMKSISLRGYKTKGLELAPSECLEVYEFVKATCDRTGRNYDLRMLINGFRDLMQWQAGHSETHWHDLLSSRLKERVVVREEPRTREGRLVTEREIAAEVDAMDLTFADKMLLWKERTSKGKSAFYDRLKEIEGVKGERAIEHKPERADRCVKVDPDDRDARAVLAKQFDFYTTDPETTRYLLDRESFEGPITEPCSGDGAMVEVLQDHGYAVVASDLREEEVVGIGGVNLYDLDHALNVVTNPPFSRVNEVAEHLISITERKCALLLANNFAGSQARRPFFRDHPPARIYPLARRPTFGVGGRDGRQQGTQWDYSWFVWDRSHTGNTETIFG